MPHCDGDVFCAPAVPPKPPVSPASKSPGAARALTARFVDTIAVAKRADFADATVPGLVLRVTPTGAKSWALRYRAAGRPRRLTLGTLDTLSLAQARERAREEWRVVGKGHDPAAEKQDAKRGHTVGDLAASYMVHAKVHKRSWRDDDRMLNVEVLPKWKSRRATDITRRDVRALLEPIAKRAPVVANRCLALVRAMLNFGLRRDWIVANPAALIERPGVERSRDRVLTDEEIALLWTLADMERPTMATLIKLRLLTAQRGGELSQLRWADVEADAFTIPADIAKNGRAHRVPITAEVRRLLDALPKVDGSPWVFPGRDPKAPMSDAKKAGQRMQDRMTVVARQSDPTATVDFRGHDLRRTAATRMAEAGVPTAHISRVLNHTEKGSRATAVYQRYEFDREKRIALEALEREILRVVRGNAKSKVLPMSRR